MRTKVVRVIGNDGETESKQLKKKVENYKFDEFKALSGQGSSNGWKFDRDSLYKLA